MTDRVDRIQAALELFAVMDGGPMPDPDRLVGLTQEEQDQAEHLYAGGLDASRSHRALRVVQLAYLVEHAPGARSTAEALDMLSDEQLTEFLALTAEDP
jgi:hypothetical protein